MSAEHPAVVLSIPARYFPVAYSIAAAFGLLIGGLIAVRDDYENLISTHCRNKQFWPSLSSTFAQSVPSNVVWRYIFQIILCTTYMALSILHFYRLRDGYKSTSPLTVLLKPKVPVILRVFLVFNSLKIATAFIWSLINSNESTFVHELGFALYQICGLVYQLVLVHFVWKRIHLSSASRGPFDTNYRLSLHLKLFSVLGEVTAALTLAYFFVQHLSTCADYTYSYAMLCEWLFSLFNLLFDASFYLELKNFGDVQFLFSSSGCDISLSRADEDDVPAEKVTRSELISLNFRTAPSKALLWIAEIYFAYLYWAALIQLCQVVYYGPMVAMKFTFDAALVLLPNFANLLLGSKTIWGLLAPKLSGGRGGIAYLYPLSIVGLLAFDTGNNVSLRTSLTAVATSALGLALRIRLLDPTAISNSNPSSPGDGIREASKSRISYALPLGLALSMMLRILFGSMDPLWTSSAVNGLAIPWTLFCATVLWRSLSYDGTRDGKDMQVLLYPVMAGNRAIYAGLSHGTLTVVCLQFLVNAGALARFLSLNPFPSSGFVCAAFVAGIWLASLPSSHQLNRFLSFLHNKEGLVSWLALFFALIFYYGSSTSDRLVQKAETQPVWYTTEMKDTVIDNWTLEPRYGSATMTFVFGAVPLVFLLGFRIPFLVERAFSPSPSNASSSRGLLLLEGSYTIGLAGLIFVGLCVTSYPFIPGGFLFRDRFLVFLISAVLLINICFARLKQHKTAQFRDHRQKPSNTVFVVFLLSICGICGWRRCVAFEDLSQPSIIEPRTEGTIEAFQSSGVAATSLTKKVSFLLWTIHFGLDNWGADSCEKILRNIQSENVDVIGLLETDMARLQNGVRDVVEYLSHNLGFPYTDYGPTTMESTFGVALISRFPILSVKRYVMPSPVGELGPLIEAVLDVFGTPLVVYVGHNGNTEHYWDRRLQTQFIGQRALVNKQLPSVFLGYLTTVPAKDNYEYVVSSVHRSEEIVRYGEQMGGEGRYIDHEVGHHPEKRGLEGLFIDAAATMVHLPFEGLNSTQLQGAMRQSGQRNTSDFWKRINYDRSSRNSFELATREDRGHQNFPYFPLTKRFGTKNIFPLYDFHDRYCQYVLYKKGQPQAGCDVEMHLLDWYRVLDVLSDISDTEIQVARFTFQPKSWMLGRRKS